MIFKTLSFLIRMVFKRAVNINISYRTGKLLHDRTHRFYWKKLHREFLPPIVYVLSIAGVELFKYVFLSKVKIVSLDNIQSNFERFNKTSNVKTLELLRESCDNQYDFNALIQSVDKHGIKEPLVLWDKPADRDYYRVKDGNHRVIALQFLGRKEWNMQKVLIFKDIK